jgi:hypothetical protein
MTTTEQRPAVPAFLNLDAIVPPDLRDEITMRQAEVREVAEQVTVVALLAARLVERLERLEQASGVAAIDDSGVWLDPLTGWDVIAGAAGVALGDGAARDEYVNAAKAPDMGVVTRNLGGEQ